MKKTVHEVVAKITIWSMSAALEGRFPSLGPFNEKLDIHRAANSNKILAGGYRFAYFGFKADAKARKECHLFDRSYQHNKVCETCFAERPNKYGDPLLTFKNFHPNAAHVMTELSHDDYVRAATELSPWLPMPGFHVKSCFRDPMHTIFLGTAKELLASCLSFWNRRGYLPGPNLAQRLRHFSAKQRDYCLSVGLRGPFKTYTPANTNLDTPSEYPELGSSFKASGVKVSINFFAKFAGDVAESHVED